jgi:hypothetical protein
MTDSPCQGQAGTKPACDALLAKHSLTITAQVVPGAESDRNKPMIDIERALLLPVALLCFLLAAGAAAGLTWRGAPVTVTIAARN